MAGRNPWNDAHQMMGGYDRIDKAWLSGGEGPRLHRVKSSVRDRHGTGRDYVA